MSPDQTQQIADAIVRCGIQAGIIDGANPLDGPQLLTILSEIGERFENPTVRAVIGVGGIGIGSLHDLDEDIRSLIFIPLDEAHEIGFDLKNDLVEGVKKIWKNGGIEIQILNLEGLEVLEKNVACIRESLEAKKLVEFKEFRGEHQNA